jgi:hypothetical protein
MRDESGGITLSLRFLFTSAVILGLAAAPAAAAGAGKPAAKRHHAAKPSSEECCPSCCGEIYRYVYAEAWYGSEKIVAPVRRTAWGDQVQVPGGAWVPCVFSCEMTVRKLRLYYWQDQGAGYVNGINPDAPRNDFWKDEWGRHDYLF